MTLAIVDAVLVAALLAVAVIAALASRRHDRERRAREAAEAEILAERDRTQAAIEGSGISLWDWNPADDSVWMDANWATLVGHTPGETRTTSAALLDFVHEEDRPRLVAAARDCLEGRAEAYDTEQRVWGGDRNWHWIRTRGRVTARDAGGRAVRVSGTNAEITLRKRVERSLAESEARFRALSELSSDLYFEMDAAFHLVTWSAPAWTRRGDASLPSPSLEAPELTEGDWDAHREVLESRRAFRDLEIRQVDDDGHETWLSVGAVPIAGEGGAFAGYRGLARVITPRKLAERRLRESESQMRQLVEFIPAAIVFVGPDERVRVHNKAYAALLGLPAEAILGSSLRDLLGPEHYGEIAPHLRRALAGEPSDYVTRRRFPDGRLLDFDVLNRPLLGPDGEVEGVIVVGIDVTRLREADRMKDHFVSVVSHELRTPLTSMRGSLGLLAAGVTGELPEEAKPMVDIALANSDRLWRLVNDLLDIEKMAAGSLTFRLADIPWAPLLAEAVDASRGLAKEFGVRFELECGDDLRVRGDADRLIQVLANLILNAAKFSPPGAAVTVSATRRAPGWIRTCVRDHGPGIPTEFRARIFTPFAQAESGDARRFGGTGLGLAISREIVEHLGGEIGFEDAPPGGTVFWFDLPEPSPEKMAE
jgi:PAS domain S-box-containing protein